MQDDILSLVTGGQQAFAPASAPKSAPPADYTGLIATAEQKYGVPPGLLHAVITKGEKSGVNAVSPKGAVGLGQLMPDTAKAMGVTDPTDPAQNIDGAGKYLGQLYARYNDPKLAVAAYNAGPGAVDKHGGVPPYPETQDYVARVVGEPAQSDGGDVLSLVTGGKTSFNAPQQPAADAPQSGAGFANMANATELNPTSAAQVFQPNAAQAKTLRQMDAAGMIDRSPVAMGTEKQPYVMQDDSGDVSRLGPGVYYVDWSGKLQQTPGKPVTAGEGALHGFGQGVEDVAASLNNALVGARHFAMDHPYALPGAQLALMEPDMVNRLVTGRPGIGSDESQAAMKTQRDAFDARYGHNGYALTGRIGGNVVGTAPLMASGDAALAPIGEAAGPVGEFLAGKLGGNLLTRGASLATRGAIEGGEAAGLTSSASDAPIQNQLMQGAAIGGALHLGVPALKAVGNSVIDTAKGLVNPLTSGGRNALVMDYLSDITKGGTNNLETQSPIPGVTRTLAQSVPGGNGGLGALERSSAASDTEFNNHLTGIRNQNAVARKAYIDSFVASPEDLQKAQAAHQSVFHKDLMAAMGSGDEAPTPAAMSANKARLGNIFDSVAAKTNIQDGDALRNSLGEVVNQAQQVLPDSEVQPLLKQVQNIADTIKPDGTLSGESYQALTRRGAPLDRAMASKGNLGFYATQIRNALDDALEASAAPEDLKTLQQARSQYRNMKLVESALPADPSQSLDPTKLLGQVSKNTSGYAYSGGGDLGKAALDALQRSKTGPVAEQQYLRGLNLTTNGEVPTLDKVNAALKKIGNDPTAPVSPQALAKLATLRDDLAMENGSNAGIGKGSDTFQKFATNALTGAIGKTKNISNILAALGGAGELAASHNPLTAGVTGLAVKGAADMVGNTYAQKNLLLQQALRDALLNPETVTLNTKVPTGSFSGNHPVVNSLFQRNAVPALVDTRNRLAGQ